MPPSKGPFENDTDGGGPPSKMNGVWNSPLAPQPVPQKLDSITFPNFLCPYLRACAFGKWWGAPFENERIGAKNPDSEISQLCCSYRLLTNPLKAQRSFLHEYCIWSCPEGMCQKLDSMPPSKGPFSANMHPIIPKLSVPIPEGHLRGQNPLQITIRTPGPFPRICIRSFPNFLRACAFEKGMGSRFENVRV